MMGTFFSYFAGLLANDMGMDLGTANTLIYVRGQGIVLAEPSVVAVSKADNQLIAVGAEAKRMLGRTPANISAIRPLKDGVIADFSITQQMIRYFIGKVHNRRALVAPRIVIGVPSGITEVEKRAVEDSARVAGAREVVVIEEPLAAAIGANLPVYEPAGNMIVDIGGGTTEVAIISLGNKVISHSLRIAGDELDEALIAFVKKQHNVMIGERTAEEIKLTIGSAFDCGGSETMTIKGRDLLTGLPKTITLTAAEVRTALQETILAIIGIIKSTLESTPPELSADIMERGIVLAGGGALLRGLDKLIQHETGLPVHLTEDPLTCVVLGCAKYLDQLWPARS